VRQNTIITILLDPIFTLKRHRIEQQAVSLGQNIENKADYKLTAILNEKNNEIIVQNF
jgi:hypothetical protein